MRWEFLLLTVVAWVMVACGATKKGDVGRPEESGNSPSVPHFLYSDLQIVTETVPSGNCPETMRLTERREWPRRITLNERFRLEKADEQTEMKSSAIHTTLQVMGFDSAQYVFDSIDGEIPSEVPFGIKMWRLPGAILQMRFLDQRFQVGLKTAPVFSFSASEKRGLCALTHHVNIFADRAGFYRMAE